MSWFLEMFRTLLVSGDNCPACGEKRNKQGTCENFHCNYYHRGLNKE